jgi:hypothetical protein
LEKGSFIRMPETKKIQLKIIGTIIFILSPPFLSDFCRGLFGGSRHAVGAALNPDFAHFSRSGIRQP